MNFISLHFGKIGEIDTWKSVRIYVNSLIFVSPALDSTQNLFEWIEKLWQSDVTLK